MQGEGARAFFGFQHVPVGIITADEGLMKGFHFPSFNLVCGFLFHYTSEPLFTKPVRTEVLIRVWVGRDLIKHPFNSGGFNLLLIYYSL